MASIQTAEQLTVSNSIGHYINGSNVSDNSRLLEITNPATGQLSGEFLQQTRKPLKQR